MIDPFRIYPNVHLSMLCNLILTIISMVVPVVLYGQENVTVEERPSGESEQLLAQEEAAFRQAIATASPSVLQIETFGGLERVGQELVADGPTTGTVVGKEGWIISSLYSFRQQPASILVTLPDGKRTAAQIIAKDHSRELVLLKIETDVELPVIQMADRERISVGQWAIALGKTYDKQQASQSIGIVSALGRAYGKAIQADAKISPINYGGPLIDLDGRAIGILAPISPGAFFQGDSSDYYDSGVGFAIPMQDIMERLPTLEGGQDIYAGKLGVVASDQNDYAGPVRIEGAAPGSPAAKSGVKAGDVIVEAAGRPVTLLAHLRHAIGQVDAGQTLEFVVERSGKKIQLTATLARKIPVYHRRYLGIRLKDTKEGPVIVAVEEDSPASEQEGIEVGLHLAQYNGKPIRTKEDVIRRLAVAELDEPITLELVNSNAQKTSAALLPTIWPKEMPQTLPPPDPRVEENAKVTIEDISLGDLPNQVYALVPPSLEGRKLGLLVLFSSPGKSSKEKARLAWEAFCCEQGWLVAFIDSAAPRAWSRKEIELAGRVIRRIDKTYAVDQSLTVVGGFGVGGRLGISAAVAERKRVVGAITLGTDVSGLAFRQGNMPLQSLDFLFVGNSAKMQDIVTKLRKLGYAANRQNAEGLTPQKPETVPLEAAMKWLVGLGRL